jgi:DNA repair exonuclease SbcCD ATPase subunit
MDPILPFKEAVITAAYRCYTPSDMDMLSDMTTVNYRKRSILSQIKRLNEELDELRSQTDEEYIAARYADFDAVRQELKGADEEREDDRAQLAKLIIEVKAWEPPTKDHNCVKQRLLEDLEQKLHWRRPLNCDIEPVTVEPDERLQKICDVLTEIEEEKQSLIKLNADIRARNQWWLDLAASIGYTTADLPLLTEV